MFEAFQRATDAKFETQQSEMDTKFAAQEALIHVLEVCSILVNYAQPGLPFMAHFFKEHNVRSRSTD
jgi:hypothetical protein